MEFSGSESSFVIRRTDIDFFVRISSYFTVLSESIVLIHIFCILRFLGFSVVLGRLKLVPEGVELRHWRSLEVRGSPEREDLFSIWGELFRLSGKFYSSPGDGTRKSPKSRYPSTTPLSQKCQENS